MKRGWPPDRTLRFWAIHVPQNVILCCLFLYILSNCSPNLTTLFVVSLFKYDVKWEWVGMGYNTIWVYIVCCTDELNKLLCNWPSRMVWTALLKKCMCECMCVRVERVGGLEDQRDEHCLHAGRTVVLEILSLYRCGLCSFKFYCFISPTKTETTAMWA